MIAKKLLNHTHEVVGSFGNSNRGSRVRLACLVVGKGSGPHFLVFPRVDICLLGEVFAA